MRRSIERFQRDQDGSTSTEWVVITAGVVGLTVGVFLWLSDDTTEAAERIESRALKMSPGGTGGD